MKYHIAATYQDKADHILDIVTHFESRGKKFDERDRNSLKLFEVDGETINVKSFKVPNLINKIAYRYFRTSKARRSFEYANRLLENGVHTPAPIGYFEERGLFFGRSYYVSKHLSYDLTYRELIRDSEYVGDVKLLSAFAKFTHSLHKKNIHFLDHSPGNTLITIKDNAYDFYLVDLNRMEFGPMDFKTRMSNFRRLSAIESQVHVMADAYASASGEDPTLVFETMWQGIQDFQKGFHRKKRLKKKLKFWKR